MSSDRFKALLALLLCGGVYVAVLYQIAQNYVFTGSRFGPDTGVPVSQGWYILVIEALVALPGTVTGVVAFVRDEWPPSSGKDDDDNPPDPY